MKDPLISYLFGSSPEEVRLEYGDIVEDLDGLSNIFESLAEEEQLQISAQPLEKVLKAIGIVGDILAAEGGLHMEFSDEDAYNSARHALLDPEKSCDLAEAGWVATASEDVNTTSETPKFIINFIELRGGAPNNDDAVDMEKLMKDAAEFADMHDAGTTQDSGEREKFGSKKLSKTESLNKSKRSSLTEGRSYKRLTPDEARKIFSGGKFSLTAWTDDCETLTPRNATSACEFWLSDDAPRILQIKKKSADKRNPEQSFAEFEEDVPRGTTPPVTENELEEPTPLSAPKPAAKPKSEYANYGFIITKDVMAEEDGEEKTTFGPRRLSPDYEERLKSGQGRFFRMYDDDDTKMYEGRYIGPDDETMFAPLDDFGTPDGGATRIWYAGIGTL